MSCILNAGGLHVTEALAFFISLPKIRANIDFPLLFPAFHGLPCGTNCWSLKGDASGTRMTI
jgi:hypothetical protein